MWTQKVQDELLQGSIARSNTKIIAVTEDLSKIKLELEGQINAAKSDTNKLQAKLNNLSKTYSEQFKVIDASLSNLSTNIEEQGLIANEMADDFTIKIANEVGRINELVNQFERAEARVDTIESEVESSGGLKLLLSRLEELEQASVALLEHNLLD